MFCHFEASDSIHDECFGRRLNLIKHELEHFLSRLVDHGAKLIFVYKKVTFKKFDFILNEENDYLRSRKLVNDIQKSENNNEKENYLKILHNLKYSRADNELMELVQSAQKYGKLCGVMEPSTRNSTRDSELATQEDALAIIGRNSYYLFQKGNVY